MNGATETWKPIPGYEGRYEVSDLGRVKSLSRAVPNRWGTSTSRGGRILKQGLSPNGYPRVVLSKEGRLRRTTVHQLVLLAFVGQRPLGAVACHRNDVKQDNRLTNLRWDSPSANARDRVSNGLDAQARKTHCKWGHEYTPENTYVRDKGRDCVACRARRRQEQSRRALEAAR